MTVGLLSRVLARRDARLDADVDDWLVQRDRVDLRHRWREACVRAGLGTPIVTPLGGVGMGAAPRLVHVEPATYDTGAHLIIVRPPGVTLRDLEDVADELAAGLGVWSIRLRPRGVDHVRVDLISTDPLAGLVPFLPAAPAGHLVLGVDEHGDTVSIPFEHLTHTVVQGATRAGKSWFAYQLLTQCGWRDDVDVVGIDPTGLLLRPWGPHPRGWRVTGTHDAAARYEDALAGLVAEMDARIAAIPARRDTIEITPDTPYLLVVLEEWAGVARLVNHTRQKPSAVHRMVSRLLAEGAKAGIRVLTLVQRAEADVVGAFERDQSLTRLSFGCADANTLKMLHPDMPNEVAELHATSPKGVALLTTPELPMLRIRAPFIGSYGAYVDAVAAARPTSNAAAPTPIPVPALEPAPWAVPSSSTSEAA